MWTRRPGSGASTSRSRRPTCRTGWSPAIPSPSTTAWATREEAIGFQGLWQNLIVLSGPTFDPVKVDVDGTVYWVSAEADAKGLVTTSVKSVAHPTDEVDEATRAKAIYAAGVRTQLLDGIFERPAATAGRIVAAARAADLGWDDPEVQRMSSDLAICYLGESALRGALEAAGGGGIVPDVRYLPADLPGGDLVPQRRDRGTCGFGVDDRP